MSASTPTAELRRREVQRVNNGLKRAKEGVLENEDVLGWVTPWLQQDLLVSVVEPQEE